MQTRYLLPVLCFSLLFITASRAQTRFPRVSEPIQITQDGKEHFYASYYGITSFNVSQTYATVLETDVKYKLPDERDVATLGLVDLKTFEFIPMATTRAWNFQEGCMAHWLDDSRIIFNDVRDGKTVSVIMDTESGEEEKTIPYPVSGVSPNGKKAVSLNFSRLRITRQDYGYAGDGQNAQPDVVFPNNDGLFLVDLETGEAELLVSIEQVKKMVPAFSQPSIEYFAHTRFSPDGSRIFWLARGFPEWNTTAFTVKSDGSDLQRCFPDGWGGSHFDWLSEDELMITGKYDAEQDAHILFTVGTRHYKKLGNGRLDFDAHGTFSPDRKWMVTDGYPDKDTGEQRVYLMEMASGETKLIGSYPEPQAYREKGLWRCDLHSRWSPRGDMIGFNATMSGSRQAYIYKLEF